MDFRFPSILAVCSFIIFLYMVVKLVLRARYPSTKVPPGPGKLPIIGNIHQIKGLPHRSLSDLAKKYGPIMRLQLGEFQTTVLTSSELAKEALTTYDTIFANRPKTVANKILSYNYIDVGFSPYGPYWRQLRRICKLELLSPSRVKTFQSIREEHVKNLIKEIGSSQGSPVNLSKKLYSMTHDIALTAAFGRECKDKDAYLSIVYNIVKQVSGFFFVNLFPSIEMPFELVTGLRAKVEKLHQEKDKLVQKILDEHKERMTRAQGEGKPQEFEDLIDVLLKLGEEGDLEFPITDDTIKAILWDIVTAGGETSAATMEWAISEMVRNPEVLQQAQEEVRRVYGDNGSVDETMVHELEYLKSVVKETLRLHPASPILVPRESSEACEIKGYEIPAKSRIIVNAWAIGRDPSLWTEAEKFNPERFLNSSIDYKGTNFEYIPFGAGRRMCPGLYFAQANIELTLANLLYHFEWNLPDGQSKEDLDMSESSGLAMTRKENLVLVPVPYQL
ncbi:hypothetical protein K2173_015538 [Erythroxylum novogranatense]|uniref:Cytochrome P450 n=1 Tax=Erythroxylum novogranatense TaxID=1862640 RepID=A0AAV8SSQ5_9ROSI|nr:hypothetical protein K2173_015538 [Erythroxylum novogranatense]